MPRLRFAAVCLLAAVLLLSGCVGFGFGKPVRVSSEKEFALMARRLGPVLRDEGLLDEDGDYLESLIPFSFLPSDFGEELFRRLSPAFRFDVDPSLLPPTFAASKRPGDAVSIRPDGFSLEQGKSRIEATLVAETDWNDDGRTDWILLCRTSTGQGTVLRDDYLLVEDTDAAILRPTLLASCVGRRDCAVFVEPSSRGGRSEGPAPATDVAPGQRNVTLPPGAPAPSGAPKSTLREKRIDG